ncbi:unnamed protein product, partial [Staurois parvus]
MKSIAVHKHHHHHHDHHHPHHHQDPHHHHHHHHHHRHHPHPPIPTTCEERREKRHVTSGSQEPGESPAHRNITLGAEVECLNASRLLTLHGMDMQMMLDVDEFRYICPAIINQIDRKSCLINAPEEAADEAMAESSHGVYSVKVAWVGG